MKNDIEKRKKDHIELCLNEDVEADGVTTGFHHFRFIHQALPEINFHDIETSTVFLGRSLSVPFLISSMTGGTKRAWNINCHLAEAAEVKGWAMGVGSTRVALENEKTVYSFKIRGVAPSVPIIVNLGAVQLNYGYGVDECRRLVDKFEADGLVLHLNGIQEIIQTGGDTNFKGIFKKIETICHELHVPVGVKEVGWGIEGRLVDSLFKAGAAFVDVAGTGGTSWSQVEKLRSKDPIKQAAAEAFANWGNPTAFCIQAVRSDRKGTLIASGGLKTGVDAAKALALGADLTGFGRSLLKAADDSAESVIRIFDRLELELKMAMFGIGAASIQELRHSPHLREI